MDVLNKVVEQNEANRLPADDLEKLVDLMVHVTIGKFNSSSLATESREVLYQSTKTLYTDLVTLGVAIRELGSLVDRLADTVLVEGAPLRSSEEDLENGGVRQEKSKEILLKVLGRWTDLNDTEKCPDYCALHVERKAQ